jgi:hypothetical protein
VRSQEVASILLVYLLLLLITSFVKHVSMVKKHKQKFDKILAHRAQASLDIVHSNI